MIPIDMNYCFKRSELIIRKDVGDARTLIDPYRRTLVTLNPVASEIWQLLNGERSALCIIDILKSEFEIEEKILKKDVIGFLQDLARREIIH